MLIDNTGMLADSICELEVRAFHGVNTLPSATCLCARWQLPVPATFGSHQGLGLTSFPRPAPALLLPLNICPLPSLTQSPW